MALPQSIFDSTSTNSECTTLVELLRWRALNQPHQKAYAFLTSEEEENSLTYRELDRQARAIGALLQRHGATGERVLLLYPAGLEYIAAFFGCLYVGAIAVPAYPPHANRSQERIASIVADAQAKFVLTTSSLLPKIQHSLSLLPDLHALQWIATDTVAKDGQGSSLQIGEKDEELWHMPDVTGRTIALLQYTSGSTATPKGVMVSHSNLISNHKMLQCTMEHPMGVPFVSWLPLFHDMGLIMNMLQALYVGSPCILLPPSAFIQSPFRWLEVISLYQAHTSGAPNFAYDLCVKKITPEQRDRLDLSCWKFASCASEPVRFQALQRFAEYFAPCGFRVESLRPGYGLAEATIFVTTHRSGLPLVVHRLKQEALERHQVILEDHQTADSLQSAEDALTETGEKYIEYTSCGRTELDGRVVIADPETGVLCSPGTVGEIWVAGSHVTQGYWNRPVETEATFHAYLQDTGEGPFLRTGDLGFLLDGDLFVTGRIKDLIIIAGRNLYPQDIEHVVEKSHPLLRLGYGAAFAIEGANGDQLVIVQEVVRYYDHGAIPEAIQAIRQAVLWEFDVEVAAVELLHTGTLPKTSSGKTQRRACRSRFLQGDLNALYRWHQSQVHDPGTDELSNHMLDEMQKKIWAQVLDLERVGSSDNFFALGGHSLLAQRLLTRIQEVFQVAITLTELLAAPTPSAFAELVAHKRTSLAKVGEEEAHSLPACVPDVEARYQPFPTTDVQQAYWLGRYTAEGGNVGNHAYIEVEATDLDLKRFQRALQRLIERHEMLRAVLLPDGRQQILKHVPPFAIKIVDLCGQESDEQAHQLAQLRQALSHQLLPLDQWPAFELWVSRLDGRRVRLHLSIESIFVDAWSMKTLLHEFVRLYYEPDLALPKLSLSFRDYVLAEASLHDSVTYRRAQQYWRPRLASLPPAPALPLLPDTEQTRRRPRFVHREAMLNRVDWQQFKERVAQIGVTPSGVLLTAFTLVLARWSKTARFSLNLSTFNRLPLHPSVNEIVGDFTSLLVLAVDHSTPLSFEDRAKRLQAQLWHDLDHASYSGIAVLRELVKMQGEGMKAAMPIVFTSLLIQDMAHPVPPPWGKTLYYVTQTPQVWLDHQVLEVKGELVFHWQSVDAMFPAGLIDAMFAAYCQLLQRLASVEASWTSLMNWELLPEQQRALFAHVNATEAPIAEKLLHTLFFEQVRQQPKQLALISPTRRLTYKQVASGALQLAQQLRDLGACPNQLVGVVMEKGWEQVVAVLGILQAGAAYLPIDANLPEERLRYLLEDGLVGTRRESGSPLVLTQSWVNERIVWPEECRCINVDSLDLNAEGLPMLDTIQSPDDLAYVIYTSGSTGVPKGVMIDHRGAVNTILDINQRFDISSTDRVLALSALNFDLSVYDIFGILAAGGTIVLPPKGSLRDPAIWMDLLVREQVTVWNTVPALLQMLVEYTEPTAAIWKQTRLRLALLSGDWIPLSLPAQIKEHLPAIEVISLGGATEASIWSIFSPIELVEPSWKSIPYGKPMSNQRFFVLNELLEPCPVWVAGQLYIGGIGLAKGYWRDEEKTQAHFLQHPETGERIYRTGDIGRYLPDGNIEFLGREDFQVKISGYRIELGEIESVLGLHSQVSAAVVVVGKGPSGMQRLVAYVVSVAGIELSEQELRTYLQGKLPEYMVPRQIVMLESLPLTPNGKVNRRALPAPEVRESSMVIAPTTAIEERLIGIWGEVLGRSLVSGHAPVGLHDHFFTLGGQSLLAVRLIHEVKIAFQVDIPLTSLFEAGTISAMARYVEDALRDGRQGSAESIFPQVIPLPDEQYQPFPTTDVQQAYWIGHNAIFELGNVGNHAYGEAEIVALDLARVQHALQRLIKRHPMLRAVILPDGQQRILEHVPAVSIEYIDLAGLREPELTAHLEHIRSVMDHQVFQVEQWPAWAICISRLPEQRLRIHLSMELLFADAWSMRILLREFVQLYHEPATCLPPLELSFRDYVLTETQLHDTELYRRSQDYWTSRLHDLPPAPQLPLAIDPASVSRPHFVPRQARMEAAKWQRLKARGAQAGLTPTGILLSAFAEVLTAWSKSPRFCINLTLFNRLPLHQQVDEIVGDFTSLLPVAVDNSSPDSFEQRARRLEEQKWRDFEHRYYSGIQVLRDVARLDRERNLPVRALMPVVFTSLLGQADYPLLWRETDYYVAQTPQVWLDHQALEDAGKLVLYWHAVEALFPSGLLDEMFAAYRALLERLATDDEVWQNHSCELIPSPQFAQPALVNGNIEFLSHIKISALPAPQERMRAPSRALAPTTAIEERLIGIWSEILGRSPASGHAPVGLHDNFFGLGGQSLLAVRLVHRVKTVFQVDIPLTSLFEAGTVAAMARCVEDALRDESQESIGSTSLPQVIPAPDEQYQPFPTTDVQQAYWIGRDAVFELGNVGNHAYGEAEVVALDLARVQLALQRLIERHPMLRAVILPDGQQRILEHVPAISIEYIDLVGLREPELVAHLEHIRSAMDHQVFQVEQWPAWAIRISRLPEQRLRIHVSMESLFVDAWSMRILLSEFVQLYQEPATYLPPLELSFRDYVLTETQLQTTELHRRSQDYWTSRLHHLPPAPQLPLAIDPASVSRPHFVPRQARMEAAKWQRLKARGAQVGLTPTGILLSAFAEILTTWSKTPRFCINLTLFHRLPLHEQVNEIVGDFTSLLPVAVDNSSTDSFEQRARRLEEQMWRDFEHRYYSGIRVLRDVARIQRGRDLAARAIMPVVFTSLLGQADYPLLWQETDYFVAQTPQVWLDHQALEDDGKLVLYWHAVEALFPSGLLDEMFAAYRALLERLATDDEVWQNHSCGLIPSSQFVQRTLVNENIEFLGREDFQVKISGHRIELGEIEQTLLQHPAVQAAVVTVITEQEDDKALETASWQQLMAYVVLQSEPLPQQRSTSSETLSLRFGQTSIRKEVGKPVIELAPLAPSANTDVLRKYRERLSYRQFLPEPLSLRQLSGFLRPLMRIELEELPKYLYPSAGSIYPVQSYLSVKAGCVKGLDEGVYYYNPELHQLTKLSESACVERSMHAAINQPIFDQAAFSLFLIGDLTAVSLQYGELARDFCLLEAGYMGQLLMMTAAEHHIGLCPLGGLDFGPLRDGLALGENHVLLHSFLGGRVDPDAATGWSFLPTETVQETGEASHAVTEEQPADQGPSVTSTTLHHFLKEKLPAYMLPSAIVILESLPLNPNGKVDRQHLPRPDTQSHRKEPEYRAPTSEIERTVASVWQELLGHVRVGISNNFFDLGGNSLIGLRMMNRLRKIFELDLSMQLLFTRPTIEGIAEVIRQEYVELLGDEALAEVLHNVSQISEEEVLLLLEQNFSEQEGGR